MIFFFIFGSESGTNIGGGTTRQWNNNRKNNKINMKALSRGYLWKICQRQQQSLCRCFHTPQDFLQWRQNVEDSRLVATSLLEPLELRTAAPFLYSVSPMADHLRLSGVATASSASGSPYDSMLSCRFPLASDALLRNSVTDFNNWSAFRLGKFYESVDALTADVAYRHAATAADNNHDGSTTFVTAGHYHSRKFHRTDVTRDVVFQSYVTHVGRSSMEIRTDALQDETLVNVCHTIMVALDTDTMKPLSKVKNRSLPALHIDNHDDDPAAQQRLALAQQHAAIRQERARQAMQLRASVSVPPTAAEMQRIHGSHQAAALAAESSSNNNNSSIPPTVADFTFRSSTVIFPEQRNVHGKLFGGFVMEEAQKLAQYAATFFAAGQHPLVSLGIDEAIFLQPIAIGDLVTFTARVVHTTGHACRVLVLVEVRDAKDRNRVPRRSNRLMFVFGATHDACDGPSPLPTSIIPERYGEILMHLDAHRRYQVEGPFADEVQTICRESAQLTN